MKRTDKRKFDLNSPLTDLNKFSKGCAPCLEKAKKVDRKVNGRKLNEIKINEIKEIVNSIFESSSNDIKKN